MTQMQCKRSAARSEGRRRGVRLLPLALLLSAAAGWGVGPAQAGFYSPPEVRAIAFNAERARALEAPVMLLAHRTDIYFSGYGQHARDEHWIWYVGDPQDPAAARIARPQVPLDLRLERFRLRHCRILRDADTLALGTDEWSSGAIRGWPSGARSFYHAAETHLPPLQAGDLVEIAYTVENRWSDRRMPVAWDTTPIREPDVPTLERSITYAYNPVLKGRVKVIGDTRKPVRHFGASRPRIDFLTGNLPPADPKAAPLDRPRVLFTAHVVWSDVLDALQVHLPAELLRLERFLASPGDSLAHSARGSRARLDAVLEYAAQHYDVIPLPLAESDYFAHEASTILGASALPPLDRAVAIAALAAAARLQVQFYLARSGERAFDEDFPTPMHFDRILLRVELTEEDRALWIDPAFAADGLTAAERAAEGQWLLVGVRREETRFYKRGPDGDLQPIPTP